MNKHTHKMKAINQTKAGKKKTGETKEGKEKKNIKRGYENNLQARNEN